MKLYKAGESHGEAMVGILTGVPSGISVDNNKIASALAGRRNAYGRSVRQQAETDETLITGVIGGLTIGNNVAFVIKNNVRAVCAKDDETPCDQNICSQSDCSNQRHSAQNVNGGLKPLKNLRPGHADLAGMVKFGFSDARAVAEGSSARNTCLDVAAGEVALSMLDSLDIKVTAFVRSVGLVKDETDYEFERVSQVAEPFFSADEEYQKKFKSEVDRIKNSGDSVGGTIEIRVKNIKAGFGGYTAENRINGAIARDLMSIQAVKDIRFGLKNASECSGTDYADVLSFAEHRVLTSYSGGVDGGMTNGAEIVISVGVKPIPTTAKGVPSVDIYGNECISSRERADTTAVFALCPVLKAKIALALCDAITQSLGNEKMKDIIERYNKRF